MLPRQIRKELFWDVNDPDMERNKRLVVDRVLQFGNLSELKYIIDLYGIDQIIQEVKHIGYLDPKTLAFVINYLQINKEDLKCFTKKQSTQQHWS